MRRARKWWPLDRFVSPAKKALFCWTLHVRIIDPIDVNSARPGAKFRGSLAVAAVLYLVEFLADKIPVVDSVWDAIHTFIRVPAGAVLAASAFAHFDPAVRAVALLAGGTLALGSHGPKRVFA